MTTETIEAETTGAPPPDTQADTPANADAVDAVAAEETPEARATREAKERSAERVARAVESEKRAAEHRAERRAKQERERVASELAQLRREREAFERERRENLEAVKKGGPAALKAKLGVDYKDLTKQWVDESSPEGQERARIARLLDEQEKRIAELSQREQARQIEQRYQSLERELDKRAEEFPHAYAMTSKMFRAAVPAVAQLLINQGRRPTEALVLKTLDELEKVEHDERETRRSALQERSKARPSNGASTQSGSSNASRAVRTLTNQDVGRSRDGAPKSEAEKDEEILANLRNILRGT